jgi:hypothetical protein
MRSPRLAALLLLATACDAAVVAQAETKAQAEAPAASAQADANLAANAQADVALAAGAQASAGATIEIAADAFKLAEITALIQAGTIETAAELELAVNDPEAKLHSLDLDADGKLDHIQVVEVRADGKVEFHFKVIPSAKATAAAAIDLATATVVADRATSQVSFSASYAANVRLAAGAAVQADTLAFSAPARFEADAVVVAQPLLAWAFVVDRPVYASLYVDATGVWAPPSVVASWKATVTAPAVALEADLHEHARAAGKAKAHAKASAESGFGAALGAGLGGGIHVGFDASASVGGKAGVHAGSGGGAHVGGGGHVGGKAGVHGKAKGKK